MGVDRIPLTSFVIGSFFADIIGSSGFERADLLWRGMQNNVIKYINSHQGTATTYSRTDYIVRPKYEDIKDYLKGLKTFQQLIDILCR